MNDQLNTVIITFPLYNESTKIKFIFTVHNLVNDMKLLKGIVDEIDESNYTQRFLNFYILCLHLLNDLENKCSVDHKVTIFEAIGDLSPSKLNHYLKLSQRMIKSPKNKDAHILKCRVIQNWDTLLSLIDDRTKNVFRYVFEQGVPHSSEYGWIAK